MTQGTFWALSTEILPCLGMSGWRSTVLKYYMEALEECPGHCEARSYLGELYLQTGNKTASLETLFNTLLVDFCGAEHASVTSLVGFWDEKGWCHPLSDSEECAGDGGEVMNQA